MRELLDRDAPRGSARLAATAHALRPPPSATAAEAIAEHALATTPSRSPRARPRRAAAAAGAGAAAPAAPAAARGVGGRRRASASHSASTRFRARRARVVVVAVGGGSAMCAPLAGATGSVGAVGAERDSERGAAPARSAAGADHEEVAPLRAALARFAPSARSTPRRSADAAATTSTTAALDRSAPRVVAARGRQQRDLAHGGEHAEAHVGPAQRAPSGAPKLSSSAAAAHGCHGASTRA